VGRYNRGVALWREWQIWRFEVMDTTQHLASHKCKYISTQPLVRVPMALRTHRLSTHSSLTSLSIVAQQVISEGLSDDITIATGLLNRPRIPRRETSFSGTSLGQQSLNDLQCEEGLQEASRVGRSRRAIQSSNTWTSSSGEVLSEHDEVGDRTVFVDEYNRLARKVNGDGRLETISSLLTSTFSMMFGLW
jgi:hypothetical protein